MQADGTHQDLSIQQNPIGFTFQGNWLNPIIPWVTADELPETALLRSFFNGL
jgi:hypothetical protein